LGEIVYWTILRTAVTIAIVWVLKTEIDEQLWYIITIALTYGLVIHPAVGGYRKFEQKNKNVIDSTICASCKHYDSSAVLCIKHDKHPSENYIPCDGIHWEPE
jgi:hypothetical protein